MDVKSSIEKPTWHGGKFNSELIRKSMFPLFVYGIGAKYADRSFSSSLAPHIFINAF